MVAGIDLTGQPLPEKIKLPDKMTLTCPSCGRKYPIDKNTAEVRCPCGLHIRFLNVLSKRKRRHA